MKKIVFSFLGVIMLGLSSCIKSGDNIQDFPPVPAFVDVDFIYGRVTLNTPYGPMVTTELQNALDLPYGVPVLASFSINYDQQTSNEYMVVYNVQYYVIAQAYAYPATGGESTDDFTLPIESMTYLGPVGSSFFFGFTHKDVAKGDTFLYEMTYDGEKSGGYPVVTIRAQKSDSGSQNSACAFDMSSFLWDNMGDNNKVNFKVQYKTGVNDKGEEQFATLKDQNGNDLVIPYSVASGE